MTTTALTQRRRRLDDAREAPAGDAVDEEAEEEALVSERGTGLHGGAGEEEQRQDVVVDAEAHAGQQDQDEQAEQEGEVEFQVGGHLAGDAEVVDLRADDSEDAAEDDGEGEGGARLGLDVVWGEALDGDEGGEGVVVESADEAEAEVEDGFFDLGGQVGEGGGDAVAVEDPGDERGREETRGQGAEEFVEIGGVGWVRNEANVEAQDEEGAEKEGGG